VPHIRVLRHYIHTPYLFMAATEAVVLFFSAYLGYATRFQEFPVFLEFLPSALILSVTIVLCMAAMGVYESRLREGYTGMMLRTAVSVFLLGTLAVAILSFLLPFFEMGRGVLLFTAIEGFILIAVLRWSTNHLIQEDALKKRVVVIGTGHRALKIASRMRRRSDQRSFVLVGFLDQGGENLVSEFGAEVINTNSSLIEFCEQNAIEEIVVAVDERRRRSEDGLSGLPLDELLDCRLSGIEVCDVQAFIEREACKIDVDLLQPSWMVFSDGFISSVGRDWSKRGFDILAASALLLVIWPVMLITAFFIGIGSRFRDPIFYRQERVGLDNKPFNVLKFRSMTVDAESNGAVWATQNDPRVTKVGAIIRKTRIDELPQLFNVLKGEMSFVGPRPERPMFVEDLCKALPYYAQRHRVKPGITGWAQLCYPYGASVEDAKEKLQYDLYYLKNHSILLDLIILFQTVEVVLVGEGAR
jgi:sugar transferase (PEP-CTERM system associated)